jgi:predicted Ser/Thr protein kinase
MTRGVSDVMATVETTGCDAVAIRASAAGERRRIGRYSVVGLLGAGGMGEVYAARDPELERMVAIKVLRPEMSSLRANSRLHREARAMAKLSHPNLVAVYDVGMDGEQLFVAMELIAGQTLRSWVRGKQTHEIIDSYLAAGRGLAAAHGAGLVHRDFKPDNVLVGDDGRVAVGDFGLARTLEADSGEGHGYTSDIAVTQAGALIGTVRYMAPEQLDRRDADQRSDQFAFCVALWEALDTDPFGPVDPSWDSETFARRRRDAIAAGGDVRGVAARRAGVPARVRRALARGLAFDPAARWPSMQALLAELAAPRRRHRVVAASAALGVLVVGAALVVTMRPDAAALAKPDVCAHVGDDIDGTWWLGDRARVTAALVASGAPGAAAIAEETAAIFDRRVVAWKLMRLDSCHATAAGTQTSDVDRRRTSCLDAKRGELQALVERLAAAPNADLVGRAVSVANHMGWTEQCSGAPPPGREERTAPSFDASTLWRPTGVYTPASAFALVDLDGRLQSVQRGVDGSLHVAADVKADAALPGSPHVTGDAPAVGVDAETNTAVVAVRGADDKLYVGTADAAREWTWETIGTTDAAPSLVVIDGVVEVAWLEHGHVRTRSRRAARATWDAPRDLGDAAPVAPALARNGAHAIAIAFATRDGKVAVRRGSADGDWQRAQTIAGTPQIGGIRLAAWGELFVVGVLGSDAHAYVAIEQPDGRWSASERASTDTDVAIIDPPTVVVFEGVMMILARDRDRALRYWLRNPNTRAYRYAPAQMWIGGRIVSGFGIGATPPGVAVAGTQLYAATRGINDQQLYALNLGRFVAVDVLGSVFGIPLGSLDVDPSANLFAHMRAFLALPGEHTWSIVTRKSQQPVVYPSANRQDVRDLFTAWVRFDCARRQLAPKYARVFASEAAFVAAAQHYRWGGERAPSSKQYAWLRDHYFDGIEYDRDGTPLR